MIDLDKFLEDTKDLDLGNFSPERLPDDAFLGVVDRMLETTPDNSADDPEAQAVLEHRLSNPEWWMKDRVDLPIPEFASSREMGRVRNEHRKLEKDAPSTGYPELDHLIHGFLPGHLYLMSGTTNVGKTAMASNFATRLAQQGKDTLYIALEPDITIVEYLSSIKHGAKFRDLTPLQIEDQSPHIRILTRDLVKTLPELVSAIENQPKRANLVVIDHIGYFISSLEGHLQEQANVIRRLAILSKEMGLAILCLTHLRKPGTSKTQAKSPSIYDIAGSATIVYDATDVLVLTRDPDPDDEHQTRYLQSGSIIVRKAKAGMSGVVPLRFYDGEAKILTNGDLKYN